MPIYEYQCRACDHRLTARQRISESPLVACPQCDADALQRLISQTSFVLKGSGWYASDYKKKPESASEGDSSPSAPESTASSDGAGESAAPATSPTTGSSDD